METIASFLAGVLTIPIFIPFVAFAAVFFFIKWRTKRPKEALAAAVNITTFFLIVAVITIHPMVKQDANVSAIWWVILFFFGAGSLIAWLQRKIKGQFDPRKMITAVWRLAFVAFTIAYAILFFTGIQHFFSHT